MAMITLLNGGATEPSLTAIQAALGLSGYTDYAVLMRPDLYGPKQDIVKFWAMFQPMDADIIGKLTDNYRRDNGFGIRDNHNYRLNDTTRGPKQAYNDVLKGDFSLWRDKPTGDINVSPYRPWDYYSEDGSKGYNNEAECPFSFKIEDITDRGYVKIIARALPEKELPEGNLTIQDLQAVGGANAIISNNENTCFGLLYTKNGGEVQVIGADGSYKVFNGVDSDKTNSIEIQGDGVYKFAYIILNTATNRFITLPYSVQEVTVTSSAIQKGYIEVYGMYEVNSARTQFTIKELTIIPRGAKAVAGNVAIYICDSSVGSNEIEAKAIETYSYSYPEIAKDTPYVFNDITIAISGFNINEVTIWAVTSTAAGAVEKTPLDEIDNSEDIS